MVLLFELSSVWLAFNDMFIVYSHNTNLQKVQDGDTKTWIQMCNTT